MLSWHRMQVTVRFGSPGPGPCPTDGLLPSMLLASVTSSPFSRAFSPLVVVEGAVVVVCFSTGGTLDATGAIRCSCSADADGLIEQEFLCFSRFRTKTLTPHWNGHRTSRSSQPCRQRGYIHVLSQRRSWLFAAEERREAPSLGQQLVYLCVLQR